MTSDSYAIVDLAFGDSGKGISTDKFCRETKSNLVVRFNGGPQALHHVVLPDGTWHGFSQFGSGTFAGVKTYLSRFMLIEPFAMLNEARVLQSKLNTAIFDYKSNPLKDVSIEEGCPIITPYHWLANRAKEVARENKKHGSCGMGVGELRADQEDRQFVITMRDLAGWDETKMYKDLLDIRERKCQEVLELGGNIQPLMDESIFNMLYVYERFTKKINVVSNNHIKKMVDSPVIFESAQGVLLDEKHGQAPYNSWTNTTFDHAVTLAKQCGLGLQKIGVVRSYFTRHGAGPFPTETTAVNHPEVHNCNGPWQGPMRQGHFDMTAMSYALECCGGIDGLVMTHMDRIGKDWTFAYDGWGIGKDWVFSRKPDYITRDGSSFVEILENHLDVPVIGQSFGPTYADFKLSNIRQREMGHA